MVKRYDIEMYSIHNEWKLVVDERFIRALKTKILKYMTSVLKYVYINKLDDIVGEYNNLYHRTIKMKPVDVKDNTYFDFKEEINEKDPKFNTHQIGLKKFLLLVKLKMQFQGHMLLTILMVKKLLEHFVKKNYKRLIKKSLG